VELIEPRVRYRETIKGRGDSKYRHKKQTGGAGQFAEVWMKIEPKPRDTGLQFTNRFPDKTWTGYLCHQSRRRAQGL